MPPNPKIYHITHLENLAQMGDGWLWSDEERLRRSLDCRIVGMSEIKRRRLEELSVACHPGTMVGQYVPFYFCPRSIMLYLLYQDNHPDLSYRGGQGPIVHLEADLHKVVSSAQASAHRWAFSSGNAGARYVQFFNDPKMLAGLNWAAIAATDWRDSFVKEAKQAEFLVYGWFPWSLIERIGVIDEQRAVQVHNAIGQMQHKPEVVVRRDWYY